MPKITDLTAATSVGATDVIPIVQSGTTKKLTATTLTGFAKTAAETSAGVTPSNYTYPPGDIRRYGAVGDGSTDDAAAFTAAISANDNVFVPDAPTAWKLGSTVTISAGKTVYGSGLGSYITKGANGAMFSLGKNTVLRDVYLDGKGATYTGVCVTVPYTAEFEGYQLIESCRIYDAASYCVQYVSGAKGAGFASKIVNCDMRVASDTVACVQWGNDPANSHGNRSILNCTAGSGPLVDCNNADNGFVIGNTIGDNGSAAGIIFGSTCAKVIVTGNRIASTTTITLQGQAHTFTGNVVASAITLASGASDCHIGNNVVVGTITDSSGQSNQVDRPIASYTATWTGASSNPSAGNADTYSAYVREGRNITVYIGVTTGSTTTYGSGAWRFAVPVACSGSVNAFGSVVMYDSSATKYYTGLAKIDAGGTYLTIIPEGSTSGETASTVPFTWATGDFIRIQMTYPV